MTTSYEITTMCTTLANHIVDTLIGLDKIKDSSAIGDYEFIKYEIISKLKDIYLLEFEISAAFHIGNENTPDIQDKIGIIVGYHKKFILRSCEPPILMAHTVGQN